MGAACTDNRTSREKKVDDFKKMMALPPNLTKYSHNKNNITAFTKAWANPQFGGSVYKPLGAMKKNTKGVLVPTKRTRTNQLQEEIEKAQLNSLQGGGFYKIMKVQQYAENKYMFYDIYILIEGIKNNYHIQALNDATE